MKTIISTLIILAVFNISIAFAQPGSLDNSFGTEGKVTTSIGNSKDEGRAVAIQPDGKILVAGSSYYFTKYNFALVRYNINGSPDNTFGNDGIITTAIGTSDDQCYVVAVQQNSKILLAGTSYDNSVPNSAFALLQFNTDGTPDINFGLNGKVTTQIGGFGGARSLVIQPDAKILLAGSSSDTNAHDKFTVLRYNTNGTLDSSFDIDGIVTTGFGELNDIANSVAIQPDGKIILAGRTANTTSMGLGIVRYDTNGDLDSSFGSGGKVTMDLDSDFLAHEDINSVTTQPDGKIIMAGNIANGYGQKGFVLIRFNTNGNLDSSFGSDGKVITPISDDTYSSVAVQPDNKIIVGGYKSSIDSGSAFLLVRYNYQWSAR